MRCPCARSIMAEAALTRWGQGACGGQCTFRAFSAGSRPKGQVHPLALRLLSSLDYDVSGFRSKSWNEFARPGSEPLDFVFTVCDNAAGEACPVWPGQPMTAHWGVEDPAAFVGPEEKAFVRFRRVYLDLEHRIKIFASLRMEGLDRLSLQGRLREIGQMSVAADHGAPRDADGRFSPNPIGGTSRRPPGLIGPS